MRFPKSLRTIGFYTLFAPNDMRPGYMVASGIKQEITFNVWLNAKTGNWFPEANSGWHSVTGVV